MSPSNVTNIGSQSHELVLFIDHAFSGLRFYDLIIDTGKTSVFGFIVGIVSCYLGYTVRGGTREVGQAAIRHSTKAVTRTARAAPRRRADPGG